MTATWTPRVSFAIPRLVISWKSWVNFSAVLNSDFISREHLRAPLILILPVCVNHNDCLHSFCCCCFGAAGTPDLRGHTAQLHRVSARWQWGKEKIKCCHSSSFTMSSKPDTSALKQIPEGGCYGYKVTLWARPRVKLFPILLLARRKNPHGWNLSEASFLRLQSEAAISRSAETFCRATACRIPRAPLMFTTCLSDLSNRSHCS